MKVLLEPQRTTAPHAARVSGLFCLVRIPTRNEFSITLYGTDDVDQWPLKELAILRYATTSKTGVYRLLPSQGALMLAVEKHTVFRWHAGSPRKLHGAPAW